MDCMVTMATTKMISDSVEFIGRTNCPLWFAVTDLEVKEKSVAIVTGGTTGIGEKVSKKLVLHGVTVIVGTQIFLCNGPALEADTFIEERIGPTLQDTYIAAHLYYYRLPWVGSKTRKYHLSVPRCLRKFWKKMSSLNNLHLITVCNLDRTPPTKFSLFHGIIGLFRKIVRWRRQMNGALEAPVSAPDLVQNM